MCEIQEVCCKSEVVMHVDPRVSSKLRRCFKFNDVETRLRASDGLSENAESGV